MDRFMERRFKPSREHFGGSPTGIDPVTFCFQGGSDGDQDNIDDDLTL